MSDSSIASRFTGRRIAVVGDVMLDHFIVGHVDRISPEAPVPVVRFAREEFRLGGAANVAHNVAALGGRVRLIGVTGVDAAADQLRNGLIAAGLAADGLVGDDARPTTRKVRVVTMRNQQVARVDYETDAPLAGNALGRLLDAIDRAARESDAMVLSDYRKGVVSAEIIQRAVSAAAEAGIPLLVDPKVPQADRYRGATLITPNHHEAEQMTQASIRGLDDVALAAKALNQRTGASVIITWGEHGMFVFDRSSPAGGRSIPAATREVADVTGAGDTVIAVLALGLAADLSLSEAASLANVAAGLVVGRFGPAVISAAELDRAATEHHS